MAERESVVSRVQKLLAVAMNEGATEAERSLAQERADALMAAHMIEQHELAKDDPARSRVTDAVWRFNFHGEFGTQMESLLQAIVKHTTCRAEVTYDYVRDAEGRQTSNRKVIIVGTPENLSYAERLWLVVFTELVRNMFPKWDNAKSLEANVYAFVRAGFKWKDIHEIVWDNAPHLISNPYPPAEQPSWNPTANYAGDGGKLKRAYHRELKERGEEKQSHTSRHSAYRSAYVSAYCDTIRERLYEMEQRAKEETRFNHYPSESKYALAVIDSQAASDARFYEIFPDKHPDVVRAKQDEMWETHRARAEAEARAEREKFERMTPRQQEEYRAKQTRKRARQERAADRWYEEQQRKGQDYAGASHGRRVAEKVNLNDNKNISNNRKELS